MRKAFFRYSFVSGLCVLLCYLSACEATKRVAADDYLLRENKVYVNGTPTDDAKIKLNYLTFIYYIDKYQYFVCES